MICNHENAKPGSKDGRIVYNTSLGMGKMVSQWEIKSKHVNFYLKGTMALISTVALLTSINVDKSKRKKGRWSKLFSCAWWWLASMRTMTDNASYRNLLRLSSLLLSGSRAMVINAKSRATESVESLMRYWLGEVGDEKDKYCWTAVWMHIRKKICCWSSDLQTSLII